MALGLKMSYCTSYEFLHIVYNLLQLQAAMCWQIWQSTEEM